MSSNKITFFEEQKNIYPKAVKGKFRSLKWAILIIALLVYYFVPFLRWDRGEALPDQAILLDIANRKAYFFAIEIWPQEVYYLTGILIIAAIGLFALTSILGRTWCGYFCFQTIWTDLFMLAERLVQGDRNERMRLDKKPWYNFTKLWKKALTHLIWLLIGLLTGGAFVLYFNDAPTIIHQALNFELSPTVTGWIIALTFSTYIMAGFAREQVCIYMCPYARFQSSMFDQDTLIISYDEARGEKRGKRKKNESWEGRGHCIDCKACVNVCPMGIDIRDGLQMECIACALCIDACNNIMDRVGLPHGLIRYDTENNQKARAEGKPEVSRIFRKKTISYIVILTIVISAMIYSLMTRPVTELHILHDRNPLFVMMSSGEFRNGYEVKILNKFHDDKRFSLSIEGIENAKLTLQSAADISPSLIEVKANTIRSFKAFISAPAVEGKSRVVRFTIKDLDTGQVYSYDSKFITAR